MRSVKNKLIKQSNAITEARYEMSATEMNVVFMLLSQLDHNDDPLKTYMVKVKDLQNLVESEVKYSHLKDATYNLRSRTYEIKEKDGLLQIGLISSAKYHVNKGTIELSLDPKIRPYLFDLKKSFTTFQLFMALAVKSKYSKRLYQMLSQYKDTGAMYISVDELKLRLSLIDSKTGDERYKDFNLFKRRVLDVAREELNEMTDILFDYKEKKTGRKITHLKFNIFVKKNGISNLVKTSSPTLNQEIFARLIKDFSLSDWQAEKILLRFDEKVIRKKMREIFLLHKDGNIRNIGAYTAQAFELMSDGLGIFKSNGS